MRLYNQLEEFELDGAMQCATEMIIGDLVTSKLSLGNFADKELDGMPPEMIKENKFLKDTMAKLQDFETEKERVDFIIDNDKIMSVVHRLAHELVKGFYYMDYGDRC